MTFSCKKSFPENPAGSKSQKYNLTEIRLLRNQLENNGADEQRAAVIKGLLWLLDFVQDNGNFSFIFTNYIPMLYETYSINNTSEIRDILQNLLKNEAIRGTSYLPKIFDNNNIQDIILMASIFERIGASSDQYIDYYNKNLKGYDGKNAGRSFTTMPRYSITIS